MPKTAPKKSSAKSDKPAKKVASKPAAQKTAARKSSTPSSSKNGQFDDSKLPPFVRKQRIRLLELRDSMLDSMIGVAKDNLRSRAEGSEASAFGMHQADAGSDSYDRDFALNLLSQEQDALYEIDEALKRVEAGTYGVCEMSGKPIPHARLEAIPFARFTVDCQAQIENEQRAHRMRRPVTSLFGLTDDDGGGDDSEEDSNKD